MLGKPKLQVILLTGRTIEQGVAKEYGKESAEYVKSAAVCFLDQADMGLIGVAEGNMVRVSTEQGSVVLQAMKSMRGPHVGIIFVPYGPWANVVVDPSTGSVGMPSFKGVPALVESCPDECVLALDELLMKQFRRRSEW